MTKLHWAALAIFALALALCLAFALPIVHNSGNHQLFTALMMTIGFLLGSGWTIVFMLWKYRHEKM